jgi:4-azaleucine resistance transporter AzlC
LAVGVFGVSFGVLATASGLSIAKTCALSLLVFTGASQFTAVSIHASGGSSASALASALLLAARNGAYGLSMSRRMRGGLARRLLAAHLTLDESTAMASAQPDDRDAEKAFWITGVAVFVFWNIGTLAGALVGDHIGDPARYGLDAAFPVGFVALLMPQLRAQPGRVVAFGGAAIALVLIPLTPVGVPVLAAGVAALAGLFVPRGAR